jgi:hypothetical protein
VRRVSAATDRRARALSALSKSLTIEIQRPVCLANCTACVCAHDTRGGVSAKDAGGVPRGEARAGARACSSRASASMTRWLLNTSATPGGGGERPDTSSAHIARAPARRVRVRAADDGRTPSFTALASSSVTLAIAAAAVRRARSACARAAQPQPWTQQTEGDTQRKSGERRRTRARGSKAPAHHYPRAAPPGAARAPRAPR